MNNKIPKINLPEKYYDYNFIDSPLVEVTQSTGIIVNMQYPKLEVNYTKVFHDRFLILDKKYIYHIGASIKDVGKKCFGITLIKYEAIIKDILSRLQK